MLYRYIDLSILCDFGSYDQSVSKSPTLSVLQKPISKSFYCTRRTTQKKKETEEKMRKIVCWRPTLTYTVYMREGEIENALCITFSLYYSCVIMSCEVSYFYVGLLVQLSHLLNMRCFNKR